MPKDAKKNGYEDEDLKKVLADIEALEDEKVSIMSEAMGRCSGIAKKIKNEIKTAKALGIPTRSLNALRKVRKLERKIEEAAADVPEDEIELFEDMVSGQFSFIAPDPEKPKASRAERAARAAAKKVHDAEQAEGAEVLGEAA